MSLKIVKKGKRYDVVDSQEGILTTHNTKKNASKMVNKLRKEKSQMHRFSS